MGKLVIEDIETGQISDGFHTFDELYQHRIELFLALCRWMDNADCGSLLWKARFHSDGSCFEGWFVAGIDIDPGDQITYHMPIEYWSTTPYLKERDRAPQWDGHTPKDVLERLRRL